MNVNGTFDFYIADTSPNFFATFIFVFYCKWRNYKLNNFVICLLVFIGLLFHELVTQRFLLLSVIDINDIIASAIAAFIAYVIVQKIDSRFKNDKSSENYFF